MKVPIYMVEFLYQVYSSVKLQTELYNPRKLPVRLFSTTVAKTQAARSL